METTLDATWTADQVMKTYPVAVSVFLALKTDCAGCYLGRFCSLDEIAISYDLPLEVVLEKLREAIQLSPERGD